MPRGTAAARQPLELGHATELADGRELSAVRPLVRASWARSTSALPHPSHAVVRSVLQDDELELRRSGHPLSAVLPLIRSLLAQPAKDHGLIMAVGDEAGRLLWVEGDSRTRSQAEDMAFLAGADWSESSMGTSAPGIALATGAAAQVLRDEHFSPLAADFSCSAVPLVDPHSGQRLGFLDLTGDDRAANSLILPYLMATASAVEAHLRALLPPGRSGGGTPGRARASQTSRGAGAFGAESSSEPRSAEAWGARAAQAGGTEREQRVQLCITGPGAPSLSTPSGTHRISPRHAEILALLARSRQGMEAAELSLGVYPEGVPSVTLRAEMTRLRKALESTGASAAGVELASRPYRLSGLGVDALCVARLIDRGSHRQALRACAGELLPGSEAPGIVAWRGELAATLREAVLGDGSVETILEYVARPEACEDEEALGVALKLLPPRSPRRASVLTRLEALARA